MIIKIIANLACSFIGTIAYAVMFQVREGSISDAESPDRWDG